MGILTDSLDRILEWHRRNQTPAARLIQPGLSEDEIVRQLQAVPFKLSREFIELYRWHNGVQSGRQEGKDDSFFEYHRFLPLEDAIATFQISYPIMKEFYELTDWVQVFQDPAGDGYGLSGFPAQRGSLDPAPLDQRGSPDPADSALQAPVVPAQRGSPDPADPTLEAPVVFLFEGEGVKVVFQSLTRMMETVAASLDEGAMIWEDGELETDFFAWGEIAHRLNPEIQYWRDYVRGGG